MFDTVGGTWRLRSRRLLHGSLTSLIGATVVGLSGCGPLGLYSIGHSVFEHNHVFKPVLPDDQPAASDTDALTGPATETSGEIVSSSDQAMPMEITHSPPADARSAESHEAAGDSTCTSACMP
ncbi:MAG TPA: hypothetical protein VHC22_10420 [Pirellulales bacterium]|nr:hypothetical protein [Pirellulales bacterium]